MGIKKLVKRRLSKAGLDVTFTNKSFPARRGRILQRHGVTTFIDVGAHHGRYVLTLREYGYTGDVVSFEPLPKSFRILETRAARDPRWGVYQVALGAEPAVAQFHLAANLASSSVLPMLDRHIQAAPKAAPVGVTDVEMRTLDEFGFDGVLGMKLDVQGYEDAVLAGARETLPKVEVLEIELSLVPLYEGSPLMPEMLALLDDFQLVGLHEVMVDGDHTLAVDGLFVRR